MNTNPNMNNGANPHVISNACRVEFSVADGGSGSAGHTRARITHVHQSEASARLLTPARKKKRCGTPSTRARAPGRAEVPGVVAGVAIRQAAAWAGSSPVSLYSLL